MKESEGAPGLDTADHVHKWYQQCSCGATADLGAVELVDGVYPTVIIRIEDGFPVEVEPVWQLEQPAVGQGPVKLTFTFREAGSDVNPLP